MISVFCALFYCNAQKAEVVDIITTKNGNRFLGYISEQKPGASLKNHNDRFKG